MRAQDHLAGTVCHQDITKLTSHPGSVGKKVSSLERRPIFVLIARVEGRTPGGLNFEIVLTFDFKTFSSYTLMVLILQPVKKYLLEMHKERCSSLPVKPAGTGGTPAQLLPPGG